ncbi:MAG: hypothetical protein K8S23_10075 [Candidatus Cloacimonetes bacterium]|nr:hypothetical protein [Candidatus Cloacimonadota bacterium]
MGKLYSRYKQYLYKRILLNNYPKLFTILTKNNCGLSLKASKSHVVYRRVITKITKLINEIYPLFLNRGINYINFNEGIRKRKYLKKVIYDNIMALNKRKIVDWIDIDHIWESHISRKANHANALLILASLEIHLKAGKKI